MQTSEYTTQTATQDIHIPQWYHGDCEAFTHIPHYASILSLVQNKWPHQDLQCDSQSAFVQSGAAIGIPVWQKCTWSDTGAYLLTYAQESLLEIKKPDGSKRLIPPGHAVSIEPNMELRFLPCSRAQECAVLLIRPRRNHNAQGRLSARIFTPNHIDSDLHYIDKQFPNLPTLSFKSFPQYVHQFPATSEQEVAVEPIFKRLNIAQALKQGGPLLKQFIAALPPTWQKDGEDVIVSVTRNELSKGWSPCRVAWHIDGTSRIEKRTDGTPNLRNPPHTVNQIIACFGNAAPTRFLVGDITLPEPPIGDTERIIGKSWRTRLVQQKDAGDIHEWHAPANSLIEFGFGVFHTG